MSWLAIIIRISIAPVLLGGIAVLLRSQRAPEDVASGGGLLLLAVIHVAYWWSPWRLLQGWAVGAVASMAIVNVVLLDLLGVSEPLLWLYPALVAGAGLRTPIAVLAIGLTALAAAAPLALEGQFVHQVAPPHPAEALGPSHSVLLSIILAGLGMNAVRQLITMNANLQATRAELAEVAVAADRERLARELHDLLARTLSLIAVKAELASRLSAKGDTSASVELADVQRLARQAVRDVRDAVTGVHTPNLEAELAAAAAALDTAGIVLRRDTGRADVDPSFESTLAWAVREAVTNVVKHSGARTCRIALHTSGAETVLEVADDGRGPVAGGAGSGLAGLADRVRAAGGTLDLGGGEGRGFKLEVRLVRLTAAGVDAATAA